MVQQPEDNPDDRRSEVIKTDSEALNFSYYCVPSAVESILQIFYVDLASQATYRLPNPAGMPGLYVAKEE